MIFDRCFGCMQKLENTEGICPHCGFDFTRYSKNEEEFALRPGTILQGRYVIGKVLGKGGFGITYIGYDMSLDIRVAVKEYYPEGFVGRDARQSESLNWYSTRTGAQNVIKSRESLIKEARNMAKIDTLPTVVRVRDVLVANQTAYLVMDYVEGETLKNLVMKNGPISYEKICTYFLPIMEDLSRIHEKGIIHRDISPDNIMLEANGKMRLLDLGAAKDLYRLDVEQGKEDEPVPASTQMVLKHGFSPMEQYRTHGGIGPWTDVYAMTATVYYLMSGKVLPTPMDRLLDKEQEEKVQGTINKLSVPEKTKEGMKKGLAILKDDRIKSMDELRTYFSKPQPKPERKEKQKLKPETVTKEKRKSSPGKSKKISVLVLSAVIIAGIAFAGIKFFHKSGEEYYNEGNYEKALTAYRQEKDIESMKKTLKEIYILAGDYMNGENGYEKNEEEAIRYYKLVAETNGVEEDIEREASNTLGGIMASNETEEDDVEAIKWFEKAMEKGDSYAAYNLADMYKEGQGVEKDCKKAMEFLEYSADNGNIWAMNKMGEIFEYGNYDGYDQEIDFEKALKCYRRAVENNYRGAESSIQRVLQVMYLKAENYRTGNNGYEKNEEEAIKYYKLVAEDESVEENLGRDSCAKLGFIMCSNETEADDAEAVSWLEKATEKGDPAAAGNLALMYGKGQGVTQDYTKAMELLEWSAANGISGSMYTLGYVYEYGSYGQKADLEEALKWYETAAENNYEDAEESIQRVLQTIYDKAYNYTFGAVDEEKAIKYYKLIAEDKNAGEVLQEDSYYYLGYIMSNNKIEDDDAEAVGWYEKAIEKGSSGAANNLAYMYEYGEGVSQNYKKAKKLYKQAADAGNSAAMFNIGYNYENGECGLDIDFEKALKWYKKALENGRDGAEEAIQRVQSAIKKEK